MKGFESPLQVKIDTIWCWIKCVCVHWKQRVYLLNVPAKVSIKAMAVTFLLSVLQVMAVHIIDTWTLDRHIWFKSLKSLLCLLLVVLPWLRYLITTLSFSLFIGNSGIIKVHKSDASVHINWNTECKYSNTLIDECTLCSYMRSITCASCLQIFMQGKGIT